MDRAVQKILEGREPRKPAKLHKSRWGKIRHLAYEIAEAAGESVQRPFEPRFIVRKRGEQR